MRTLDQWWDLPPAEVVLSHDAVHVWRASLDQPVSCVQRLVQTLSVDERKRAERLYFEQDRMRFIVGRGLLRTILGCYVGIEPRCLQFCYGPHGKPALAEPSVGETLQFNMAHAQGLALYAVTCDREIGIDLECVRSIAEVEQIVERFFSAREMEMFRALPPSKKQEAFFTWWTCKEAYLKASGDGLSWPLDRIDISLVPEEPARLLSIHGDAQEAFRWTLQELKPASSYVAALVVEGHGWHLACWQWPEEVDTTLLAEREAQERKATHEHPCTRQKEQVL